MDRRGYAESMVPSGHDGARRAVKGRATGNDGLRPRAVRLRRAWLRQSCGARVFCYSLRRATIGSILLARCAGSQQAMSAMVMSVPTTTP